MQTNMSRNIVYCLLCKNGGGNTLFYLRFSNNIYSSPVFSVSHRGLCTSPGTHCHPLSTCCYRQCPSDNPVCLSLPACTGVSVGCGPSRRGAGLKDACVCGCESLRLIPHKGYTSDKWVCFLILPTAAYLSSLCMSSGLSVVSLSTFPDGEGMLVFLFLWTVYSCSLPLFLLSPDTFFRTSGVLSKLGSLDCCKWVANIFCRLFGYFTLLMMNLLVVMNLFSFTNRNVLLVYRKMHWSFMAGRFDRVRKPLSTLRS